MPPMMQNPGAGKMPSMPPSDPSDAGGDAGCPDGCIPVPLAALSQPDDQEQMQTPGQGDSITFQVDAVVDSINGETAYVKPSAVNGTPLAPDDEPDPEGDPNAADDQEGQDLQQAAQGMSQ